MTRALLLAAACALASCAGDDPVLEPPPSVTSTSTTTIATPTTNAATSSTTSSTTVAPTEADPTPFPVALTLRTGSEGDGELIRDTAITYLGTNLGPDPQWGTVNFAGVAGSASTDRLSATPVDYDGSPDDRWPADQRGSLVWNLLDQVLPDFVDEGGLRTDLASGGASLLQISDVGISGTVVEVTWELVSIDDDDMVVRVDSDFDEETIHRGYRFVTVGNAAGEFRVSRSNALDMEGRLDVEFDLVDDHRTVEFHQWWEATSPPPAPDPDEWRRPSSGVEVFADVRQAASPDPDSFSTQFGYGGASWAGRLEIDQTWTQAGRAAGPTSTHTRLAVDSRFTPAGQWLELALEEWRAEGPPFGAGGNGPADGAGDGGAPPPFALVVDRDGRIGSSYRHGDGEWASRNQRIWFAEVLGRVLPAFPDTRLSPGTEWQVRARGEQDGAGPLLTLTGVEDGLLHLDVSGSFGTYFGDRYDGFTVDAEIDGSIVLDWGAAIPLEADIETKGTITFGTAGVPDPTTTEPWRSTLRVRATAQEE